IGDPSGRNETRPPLTKEQVVQNAKTYKDQVFKILDPKKTEVVFNSKWLNNLKISDVITLAGKYTVARMLERDDFAKRYQMQHPISIHEFLYPLLQGYDSVELKSDVEIGGNDQKFNLLVGRELQREFKQEPQVIITMPLLEGTDGVRKMSKSYDNYIGITEEPKEIYGKVMSISDDLMFRYYELLTNFDLKEIKQIHPKEAKQKLASYITAWFHNEKAAQKAEEDFNSLFTRKEVPDDMDQEETTEKSFPILKLLTRLSLVSSNSAARRLIAQGGVTVIIKRGSETLSEKRISDPEEVINGQSGEQIICRVGRKIKGVAIV
ncbi:MAG: tyrosine--tRNA ligase, partial [Candidatus Saganbacteria bacterium]|nr:tyrosine--tRNA ligase [Candidatus Saganbacteria bacterium]